jgi:hypothetical protein
VILVVLVAGFALVVEPAAEHAGQSAFATVIDFSYPVLDVLLVGAILGVYGLMAWRPDRMWLLIGVAVVTMTAADAAFAIQQARGVANDSHYAFVWTLGALLIAAAAWVPVRSSQSAAEITGLRAIFLLLLAQAFAAGIQIYAFFEPIGRSERIVTVVVLAVTAAQIIMTRPRSSRRPSVLASSTEPTEISSPSEHHAAPHEPEEGSSEGATP